MFSSIGNSLATLLSWQAFVALIMLVIIFAFAKRIGSEAGSDVYKYLKGIIGHWKQEKGSDTDFSEESNEAFEEGEIEQDWSKRRAFREVLLWCVLFSLLMVLVRIPELFLRPVLWKTMESIIYMYIAVSNIIGLILISMLERLNLFGLKDFVGHYPKRRKSAKSIMAISAAALTLYLTFDSLSERRIYATIATEYCLTDLPSGLDRWFLSRRTGESIQLLDERVLRARMRSLPARDYVSAESCRE